MAIKLIGYLRRKDDAKIGFTGKAVIQGSVPATTLTTEADMRIGRKNLLPKGRDEFRRLCCQPMQTLGVPIVVRVPEVQAIKSRAFGK